MASKGDCLRVAGGGEASGAETRRKHRTGGGRKPFPRDASTRNCYLTWLLPSPCWSCPAPSKCPFHAAPFSLPTDSPKFRPASPLPAADDLSP